MPRRGRRSHWQPLAPIPPGDLPTALEIDAARGQANGWDREQLARWGVPWPPPKRWRRDLIQRRSVFEAYATREGIAAISRGHGTGCPCDACLASQGDDEAWARVKALV